jgi:hypothetical protein
MSTGLYNTLVAAMLKAGASVEIVTSTMQAYKEWERAERPRGATRKYADLAASKRAEYQRRRAKQAIKAWQASGRPRERIAPRSRAARRLPRPILVPARDTTSIAMSDGA